MSKSCLSYFGSDSEVARLLASQLKGCQHVTIPFVGGASIIPHLNARAIVANDLNSHAINFYRIIAGRMGEERRASLIAKCEATLSHPDELRLASLYMSGSQGPVLKAWAYWALCWIGRKGKGGTKHLGGSPSIRRTAIGGSNNSRLKSAATALTTWGASFERCEWESICFRELLPKVADKRGCGIYCDPPWVKAGRNYLHSFTEADHRDLASLLSRFEKTTILIRYDNAELLQKLYPGSAGWAWRGVQTRTQTNGRISEVWIRKNK